MEGTSTCKTLDGSDGIIYGSDGSMSFWVMNTLRSVCLKMMVRRGCETIRYITRRVGWVRDELGGLRLRQVLPRCGESSGGFGES